LIGHEGTRVHPPIGAGSVVISSDRVYRLEKS
jgi:hypothetical protein